VGDRKPYLPTVFGRHSTAPRERGSEEKEKADRSRTRHIPRRSPPRRYIADRTQANFFRGRTRHFCIRAYACIARIERVYDDKNGEDDKGEGMERGRKDCERWHARCYDTRLWKQILRYFAGRVTCVRSVREGMGTQHTLPHLSMIQEQDETFRKDFYNFSPSYLSRDSKPL